VLEPLLAVIGSIPPPELSAYALDRDLATVATTRSSANVGSAHLALTRAIRLAQASDVVSRNVLALTPARHADRPAGQAGA
jgi:hypothetical protein